MGDKKMIENVILVRNILYRCFVISIAFYLLSALFYFFHHSWTINLIVDLFKITNQNASVLMLYFILLMRMFILFVFLIPALALHWTGYSLKKKISK